MTQDQFEHHCILRTYSRKTIKSRRYYGYNGNTNRLFKYEYEI